MIFVINPSFTNNYSTKINSEIKVQSDKNYRLPRARGGRGLTKVFTKIKTFANLERFTKFLCHENLEPYGILNSVTCVHCTF